jgi:probable H4MPT-linked C1 transfer pathway protein
MVAGWDIGGVNTKAARIAGGLVLTARTRPFELQRDPEALTLLLHELAREIGVQDHVPHAVTMTAELSQMFRTKREGVAFVLDAVEQAFPADDIHVFTVSGQFLAPAAARRQPLAVAAANWAATARALAVSHPDALVIDVGTTTTDCIPIVGGRVAAAGWHDPDRLVSGELVYTGALRTPIEAIVSEVPYRNGAAGVSAEGFALAGDAHVWRKSLEPREYTVPTPDGRPATREFCGERLARVICADTELIDVDGVSRIADAVADAQIRRIAAALNRIRSRHPTVRTALVTGIGAFIAAAAARVAGLDVIDASAVWGTDAARCAPAAAVALLLEQELVHA